MPTTKWRGSLVVWSMILVGLLLVIPSVGGQPREQPLSFLSNQPPSVDGGPDQTITPADDEVAITANPAANVLITEEVRVAASSDDAEEKDSGSIQLASSDLELVFASSDQTVGMRFNGLNVPRGANIANAYVQFQVDETDPQDPTNLTVQGEYSDNAATFTSASGDISSRPRTTAAVSWSPVPWTTVGAAGPDQQTPDIAPVVQEIVNRFGWTSGNSLVIIITGSGERVAEAYDGVSSAAPLLHVEYDSGLPVNIPPVVTISTPAEGSTYSDGEAISFTGTAIDAEDGDVSASLLWQSNVDGPIGTGGSFSRSDLALGVHTITATVTDGGGLTASDTATIGVLTTGSAVFVGAGDIAYCGNDHDEETATLLDNIAGTVFTLGDNAYLDGTAQEFSDCYEPSWGRHKDRTYPSPGNHDYHTLGATGYFNYFGTAAGDPDKGYYSYNLGAWHIIALNSECSEVGGCDANDPQGQWLQADLAANPSACTLAYWHKPLFNSGFHGNDADYQAFWQILYDAKADVVLNGHAHSYERFAAQDPIGSAEPGRGIREFIVGTGGRSHTPLGIPVPNSEVFEGDTYGVLKMTLHPDSYDWEFIPIAGQTFTDSGSALCVSSSSANQPPNVDAGPNQTITLPAGANLNGTVGDDGLPNPPGVVTPTWSVDSGPGSVAFGDANAVDTTAGFSTAGTYILRLTADDSDLTGSDTVTITVDPQPPTNQPPNVDAGPNQTITLPAGANLNGTVSDDGLPNPPGVVTPTWSVDSGPGTVTFGDANAVDTTAGFSTAGTYILRLTADDSDLTASDTVTITVDPQPPTNQPPNVDAGPNQTITLPAGANLNGTISDDGLPNPPGVVTPTWSVDSGPGSVAFGDANAVDTTAGFSTAGTYILRLTADDSELIAFDELMITVSDQQAINIIYVSSTSNGSAGGIDFGDEDIMAYDRNTGTWSMYFDGSDVGAGGDIDAFYFDSDGTILLSLSTAATLPDVGAIDDSDIVRFVPTSTGSNTAGSYEWYFDGSDVDLANSGEDVDAIGFAPDGSLIISTSGSYSVSSISSGKDEDLLIFTGTSFGSSTSGSWALYFDGSDVALDSTSSEDVHGAWIGDNNDIYLTTNGSFAVFGAAGDGAHIFKCAPGSIGDNTSCTFSLFWDGSANGLAGEIVDGIAYGQELFVSPPVANDDDVSTTMDTDITINVAANDTDLDGNLDPASASTTCAGCSDPASGNLVNNADGTFNYTPNPSFIGDDGFVYEICDADTQCDTAIVTIEVLDPNAPISVVYVSAEGSGIAGGIDFKDEDIMAYDLNTGTWAMYFHGSDVGADAGDIDAFHVNSDGTILLSFTGAVTIPDVGAIDDSDIVRFVPTSTGSNTAGSYEWHFDASDVELTTNGEDIDAISFAPDGRLVISTSGSFNVTGVSGRDEDLLIFTDTSFGSSTSGSWALYFDGSDVALDTASSEDVVGLWIDESGDIYVTTKGIFSVTGATGDGADVFKCAPGSTGVDTTCAFSLFWVGAANDFAGYLIDGIFLGK